MNARAGVAGLTGALRVAAVATAVAAASPAAAADLWSVYQTALGQDAAYRAAGFDYESARLALPLAKSAFRPQVSLQGTTQHSDTVGTPNGAADADHQINLNADLRIYDRMRRGEVGIAEMQTEAARLRFWQSREDLITRVADRYFRLLAAVDGREVARRQKASIQRQMDLTAERLRVGLGTETDLLDARARFQQAVSDEIQAANRIDNAAHALRQITGAATAEAPAPLMHDAPLPHPSPADLAAWIAAAQANNLGVRAAAVDLGIARMEIARQKAARAPSVTLSAGHRWRDTTIADSGRTDSSSVTATLNWPLHQRGAVHLRARQASLRFNAAEQRLIERRRQVEADTASAYLEVASGISRVRALREAVRAGAGSLRAKEEGFRAGLTTNLDVLDAQRDLSRSRTDYLSARYDFIRAVLRLERAAGDLDEDDLRRVNSWLSR